VDGVIQPSVPRRASFSRIQARTLVLCCIAFGLFFSAAFFLQQSAHAYRTEIGAEFDDASHYVTGLMVRDYIAQGFPSSPSAFAQSYYAHYPKVGLGHWPPVFYVAEALWMLMFGNSIASVLVLMAVITALIAATIFYLVMEEWQAPLAGLACGAIFLFFAGRPAIYIHRNGRYRTGVARPLGSRSLGPVSRFRPRSRHYLVRSARLTGRPHKRRWR
jgi:predicted secreted protein